MCVTSKKSYITRDALKDAVQEPFNGGSEIAVFIMLDMVHTICLEDICV